MRVQSQVVASLAPANRASAPSAPAAPSQPVDQVVSTPQETGGHKAFRVLVNTAAAATVGGFLGHLGTQGGSSVALAATGGAVVGTGYGTSAGWQAGKKLGLHVAGGKGNDVAKGISALALTFGGPVVGGGLGLVAGAASATMGGPIVTGAIFGALALTRELCA